MADKRTMTLNLTDQEMRLLDDLSARKDVSKTALLRQALRLARWLKSVSIEGKKLIFEDEEIKMMYAGVPTAVKTPLSQSAQLQTQCAGPRRC